ncbi:MAG: Fe-S cluster assembly protein SufD [Cyanobacteriota bacterium]|nr:Fe-S cluster assembly protein SufD [Cyanobacteriota bacterium]
MTASLSPLTATEASRDRYLPHLVGLVQAAVPSDLSLPQRRPQAAAWLQEQTFPSPRQEDWRFTDLAPMLAIDFQPAAAGVPLPALPDWADLGTPAVQLVLVNGHFCPALSQMEGLPIGAIAGSLRHLLNQPDLALRFLPRLAQASGQQEVFTSLNTVGFADGVGLWIPAATEVPVPVQILHLTSATASPQLAQPRSLVVLEAGSHLTLVEQYGGDDASPQATNAVTEIWLEPGAQIHHSRLQREGEGTFHLGKTAVMQAADSQYMGTALHLGSRLNRHDWQVYQTGPQTTTDLQGLAFLTGQQHSDTHSLVALGHPHGRVVQRHRTVVDDRGHSVFNGRIVVPQAAQFTNASQLNRNLLLSNQARVDTKPQLEIVADNVKCAHGATVSQLQADEIFYLQSRGISASQAQRLLIYAFAMDILNTIPIVGLRDRLGATLAEWKA